jgi:hypothetical protein
MHASIASQGYETGNIDPGFVPHRVMGELVHVARGDDEAVKHLGMNREKVAGAALHARGSGVSVERTSGEERTPTGAEELRRRKHLLILYV